MIKEGFKYRHREWDIGSYMYIQRIDGNVANCQYFSSDGPGFKDRYLVSGFSDGWVIYVDREEELDKL